MSGVYFLYKRKGNNMVYADEKDKLEALAEKEAFYDQFEVES